MESAPAVFAGLSFGVFGLGLLLWTTARTWRRQPVAEGVHPVTAVAVAGVSGVLAVAAGAWMLLAV